MREQLREALDGIHAEPELKAAARAAVVRQAGRRAPRLRPLRLALAAAACAVAVLGGQWLYFTPTAHISIDINPSLELGINRFDRVVSVQGWNEDGTALAGEVSVENLPYTEAVQTILSTDTVQTLLADDAVVEIGVIGEDETHCARMLADVEACTDETNTHCYQADTHEVEKAHDCGLSYGKYSAYRELAALDPTVTPEEVQGMTMREIRDRIAALSGTASPETAAPAASGGAWGSADCEAAQNQETEKGHHGEGHHGGD